MGTNPLAFAAPAKKNASFELDMATTTVAAGKVKVYKLNHKPVPSGWVVDGDGRPVTDEATAFQHVFERPDGGITPLGGSRELGGHKGYGLAVMVHILGGDARGRVVLAAAQQDPARLGPAQHRPLLHGHRSGRVPRRGRVRAATWTT